MPCFYPLPKGVETPLRNVRGDGLGSTSKTVKKTRITIKLDSKH